jgi:hypothetical protein
MGVPRGAPSRRQAPGDRVLTLEQAGQNRKTIKDPRIATDDADAGADTNTPA